MTIQNTHVKNAKRKEREHVKNVRKSKRNHVESVSLKKSHVQSVKMNPKRNPWIYAMQKKTETILLSQSNSKNRECDFLTTVVTHYCVYAV